MLRHALAEFALSFTRGAGELLVIRTSPGAASALGEVLDRSSLSDIAGTIAGDNTILVVPSEGSTSRSVERVLSELMEA
jgi:transcriptional regulator of arginine metabolism